jgi:hypothetical protein
MSGPHNFVQVKLSEKEMLAICELLKNTYEDRPTFVRINNKMREGIEDLRAMKRYRKIKRRLELKKETDK